MDCKIEKKILISVLTTSRNRPNMLYENCKQMFSLAANLENIELIIYIDEDDYETISIYEKMRNENSNVRAVIGERLEYFGHSLNILYKEAKGDILFLVGDDCLVSNKNWDEIVLNEFNKVDDKILLVYGDDGNQGRKTATVGFIHKNWVETIGYLVPLGIMSRTSDSWLTKVAQIIKRDVFIDDLKIKHLIEESRRNLIKDAEWNKYRDTRKKASKLFRKSEKVKNLIDKDAAKLKQFIKGYKNE